MLHRLPPLGLAMALLIRSKTSINQILMSLPLTLAGSVNSLVATYTSLNIMSLSMNVVSAPVVSGYNLNFF